MRIYIYEIVFLSFLSLFFLFLRSRHSKLVVFSIGCLSLLVLTSLRDITSTEDTLTYYRGFLELSKYSWSNIGNYSWEIGYTALNKMLSYIIYTERQFLVIMSIITLVPVFFWIWKNSSSPCLGLVLFVGMGAWKISMIIYRQWIAMVVLFYSLPYIKERKFFHFLALVLLAICFHKTALIFLVAYFLYGLSVNGKLIGFAYFGAIVLPYFARPFLQTIVNMVDRYRYYLLRTDSGYYLFAVLLLVTIVSFFLRVYKVDENNKLYFIMVFLASLLQIISITVFSLWARVVLYFQLYLIPLLTNVVYVQSRKGGSAKQVLLWNVSMIVIAVCWLVLSIDDGSQLRLMWE